MRIMLWEQDELTFRFLSCRLSPNRVHQCRQMTKKAGKLTSLALGLARIDSNGTTKQVMKYHLQVIFSLVVIAGCNTITRQKHSSQYI